MTLARGEGARKRKRQVNARQAQGKARQAKARQQNFDTRLKTARVGAERDCSSDLQSANGTQQRAGAQVAAEPRGAMRAFAPLGGSPFRPPGEVRQ
jgi:hypothetical protein